MIQTDAAQVGQFGGSGQEWLKVRDGQVRLPIFDQLHDLANDPAPLADQRQVGPKAGEQFHTVVMINKREPGDLLHVRQARLQHLEGLVAGKDFHFMPEPGERPRDGKHAR